MVRWRTIQLSTSLSSFGTDLRFAMEISHQKVEESPASRWQWCWEPMWCPAVSVQLFAAVGVRYRRSGCSKGERCNKIRGKKKSCGYEALSFCSPHTQNIAGTGIQAYACPLSSSNPGCCWGKRYHVHMYVCMHWYLYFSASKPKLCSILANKMMLLCYSE